MKYIIKSLSFFVVITLVGFSCVIWSSKVVSANEIVYLSNEYGVEFSSYNRMWVTYECEEGECGYWNYQPNTDTAGHVSHDGTVSINLNAFSYHGIVAPEVDCDASYDNSELFYLPDGQNETREAVIYNEDGYFEWSGEGVYEMDVYRNCIYLMYDDHQEDSIFAWLRPNVAHAEDVIEGYIGTIRFSVTEEGACTVDCFSSVLFLPGLMGSRLYLNNGSETELWVSTDDTNHTELLLDSSGQSIDSTIYTKNGEDGIIDEINLNLLPDPNIYKSFIDDLKKWKSEDNIISDYALIPYDWRLSLEDIITNGSIIDDGVSYNLSQDFSESFILKKLEELQVDSKSGKVTIVAHSNGGLVAKALIQKLKDTNHPLYEKIDKVILVAVPQVGTPDAMAALLHGTELGHGFIMNADRSRQISENMPTIYNLLPSEGYFTTVDPAFAVDKLVSFEDTPFFNPQTSQYGVFVSNLAELKNYILGTDGRVKPSFDDTVNPNIGNSVIYTQAENTHQVLDNWEPHPDTKVVQVAGWGEETLAGLDYVSIKDATERISYKPRWVVDGDATVVVPSALWMSDSHPNVERWWVDLAKFNGNDIFREQHRNILEIPVLRDFLKAQIENIGFIDLENIVVGDDSTLVSDNPRLHYTLHSPLTLGVMDSEGKYTGQDPTTGEIKQEIPGVNYKQIGEVQFLSVPADNTYTLKMNGYENGYFSLDVDKQLGNEIMGSISFKNIPSSTSTVATLDVVPDMEIINSVLQLDIDGDGTIEETILPDGAEEEEEPEELSLNQLILLIKEKINTLTVKDNLKKNLTKRIESLEKKIQKKKEKDAKVLAKLGQKIIKKADKGKIDALSADEIIAMINELESTTQDVFIDSSLLSEIKLKIQSLNIKQNLKNDLTKRIEKLENKQAVIKKLSNITNNIEKKGNNGKLSESEVQELIDLLTQIESVI